MPPLPSPLPARHVAISGRPIVSCVCSVAVCSSFVFLCPAHPAILMVEFFGVFFVALIPRTVASLVEAAILAKGRGERVAWVGGADAYSLEVRTVTHSAQTRVVGKQ